MLYSVSDLLSSLKRSWIVALLGACLITGIYSASFLNSTSKIDDNGDKYTSTGIIYVSDILIPKDRENPFYPPSENRFYFATMPVDSARVVKAAAKAANVEPTDIIVSSPFYLHVASKKEIQSPFIQVSVTATSAEIAEKATLGAMQETNNILKNVMGFQQVTIFEQPSKAVLQDQLGAGAKLPVKKIVLLFSLVFVLIVFGFAVKEILSKRIYTHICAENRLGSELLVNLGALAKRDAKVEKQILNYKVNQLKTSGKNLFLVPFSQADEASKIEKLVETEVNCLKPLWEAPEQINNIQENDVCVLVIKAGAASGKEIALTTDILGFKGISNIYIVFHS